MLKWTFELWWGGWCKIFPTSASMPLSTLVSKHVQYLGFCLPLIYHISIPSWDANSRYSLLRYLLLFGYLLSTRISRIAQTTARVSTSEQQINLFVKRCLNGKAGKAIYTELYLRRDLGLYGPEGACMQIWEQAHLLTGFSDNGMLILWLFILVPGLPCQ